MIDTTVYAFGEEGCHCPKCGRRVDYPSDEREADVECHCGYQFRAGWADPQCGNCREFLDDPDAEDDSLCPDCSKS